MVEVVSKARDFGLTPLGEDEPPFVTFASTRVVERKPKSPRTARQPIPNPSVWNPFIILCDTCPALVKYIATKDYLSLGFVLLPSFNPEAIP